MRKVDLADVLGYVAEAGGTIVIQTISDGTGIRVTVTGDENITSDVAYAPSFSTQFGCEDELFGDVLTATLGKWYSETARVRFEREAAMTPEARLLTAVYGGAPA